MGIRKYIDNIKSILKNNKYNRACYAVLHGIHKGSFIVYMSEDEKMINFLVLPDMTTLEVPKEVFNNAIERKIVDYIRKLPNNVYKICVAQYNESKSKDNINRLKQSAPSSSVDNREHQE